MLSRMKTGILAIGTAVTALMLATSIPAYADLPEASGSADDISNVATGIAEASGQEGGMSMSAQSYEDGFAIAPIADVQWTGGYQKPEPVVTYNGLVLTNTVDYTLSYKNNSNVGVATVTATGKSGTTYKGMKATKDFSIVPGDLSKATVRVNGIETIPAQAYTGSAIKPTPKVYINDSLISSSKYIVNYENNVNPGTASITIVPKGNELTNSKTLHFKIGYPLLQKEVVCSFYRNPVAFTGKNVYPKPTLTINGTTLIENTDYKLSWENNINVGNNAKVVVTPIGKYEGSKAFSYSFAIKMDLSSAVVTLDSGNFTYTGSAWKPSVKSVMFGANALSTSDYMVEYVNNINAGTATVKVNGKGNYMGTAKATFTIGKATQSITATANSITKTYDGKKTVTNIGAIASGKGKLTYRSSNTKVAAVNAKGAVTTQNAGKATITVSAAANANYKAATKTIAVNTKKATPKITLKKASASVTAAKAKKSAQAFWLGATSTSGGKLSYTVSQKNKNITFQNGKATLKKGTYKKGTYSMKVKITTAERANYNKRTQEFTIKFIVK